MGANDGALIEFVSFKQLEIVNCSPYYKRLELNAM